MGSLLNTSRQKAGDNHRHGIFWRNSPLGEVEQLVFPNLGGRCFMLHPGGVVLHLDVGEGVGARGVADQHGVTLGVIAGSLGLGTHLHQPPVAVAGLGSRDALGDNGALRILADVDHLGAGVGLLHVVGQRHGIELAHGVVTHQHTAGVLPGDGGAGFHLGPGNLGVLAGAEAPLGDKVVDTAFALLISSEPVLARWSS